jgi:phosphocarrier protein HPr
MPIRLVTIGSRTGLHARPAALFVAAATAAAVPVTIAKGEGPARNARSILAVLSLGAIQGDQVQLAAEGDGADACLDELAVLLSRDLDDESGDVAAAGG